MRSAAIFCRARSTSVVTARRERDCNWSNCCERSSSRSNGRRSGRRDFSDSSRCRASGTSPRERARQPTLPVAQDRVNCLHRWHDTLRRFAGRQRPDIGDQIGQRHVDFVADRRHDRNARSMNRADDDFFVERPQVFQAAAAAADDQHVDRQRRVDSPLRSLRQFLRLRQYPARGPERRSHERRPSGDAALPRKSRTAAPVGLVTNAIRRGKAGSGRFRSGANKPSAASFSWSCRNFSSSAAEALQMQFVDDQFVFAARGVQIQMPANDHFHAIVQFAADALGRAFPDDGADLRVLVFQRQVAMARRAMAAEVGNFAADPNDGKGLFEQRSSGRR